MESSIIRKDINGNNTTTNNTTTNNTITNNTTTNNTTKKNKNQKNIEILSISGQIGSGKTTVANYLNKTHDYKMFAFADQLKELCSKIFLEDVSLYHTDKSSFVVKLEKHNIYLTRREALQRLGMLMREYCKSYWIRSTISNILDGYLNVDDENNFMEPFPYLVKTESEINNDFSYQMFCIKWIPSHILYRNTNSINKRELESYQSFLDKIQPFIDRFRSICFKLTNISRNSNNGIYWNDLMPAMHQLRDPYEMKKGEFNLLKTYNYVQNHLSVQKSETQKIVIHDLRFLNERFSIKKLENISNIKCKFIHLRSSVSSSSSETYSTPLHISESYHNQLENQADFVITNDPPSSPTQMKSSLNKLHQSIENIIVPLITENVERSDV